MVLKEKIISNRVSKERRLTSAPFNARRPGGLGREKQPCDPFQGDFHPGCGPKGHSEILSMGALCTHSLFSHRGRESAQLPVLQVDLFPAPSSQLPGGDKTMSSLQTHQYNLSLRAGFRTRATEPPQGLAQPLDPGRAPTTCSLASVPFLACVSSAQRWRGVAGLGTQNTLLCIFAPACEFSKHRAKRKISQCPTRKSQSFSV